jgi:hypothetical protein
VPGPHAFAVRARLSKKPLDGLGTSPAEALAKADQRRSSCALDDRSRVNPPCDIVAPDAAASTASRSNVRDDRDTPLMRDRMAKVVNLIWVFREAIYFSREGLDST